MTPIGYVFDADGFRVNRRFLAKELAIGDMLLNTVELRHFEVGSFYELHPLDRTSIKYATNHIHGLKFFDYYEDLEQDLVLDYIREMCEKAEKENVLVAYKGGNIESDYLKTVGYAHLGVNLEDYKCPKVEALIEKYNDICPKDYSCRRHMRLNSGRIAHCSRMEVHYFMEFVKREIQDKNKWSCII
jgi:hypothetical protein